MLKALIKSLTPPAVLQLHRRLLRREPLKFYWRGVYANFAEVPTTGLGFRGEMWLKSWRTRVESTIPRPPGAVVASDDTLIYSLTNYLLPLVGAVSQKDKKTLRILDFGGGLGAGYLAMLRCLPERTNFEFHIVDNAETCSVGTAMFRDFPNLHFHSNLPGDLGDLDVVHLCSALQYIEDYRTLLRDVAKKRPKYVFLVSLQAGQNPTFASAQLNFEDGSVVPCWFFNLDEIIQVMNSSGYELSYKSTTDRQYEMSNFDETHRVSRYCNLLFIDNLYLKQHENDTK